LLPRTAYVAALAALVPALAGCFATVRLDETNRAAIRSVSVVESVRDEARFQLFGPAPTLYTAIPIAVAAADAGRPQIATATLESRSEIRRIVRERFAHALAASGAFPAIVGEKGDAEVSLAIFMLGFGPSYGISRSHSPVLGVEARLVRRSDGALLARSRRFVTGMNPRTPARTLAAFASDPELLRAAFATAAEVVGTRLVIDLERRR